MKAVIFDYGEVLCTPDPVAHQRLLSLTGLDREPFDRLYWRDRHDYDLGRFDGRAYWARFARDAGRTFTPAEIDALIATDVVMWTHVDEPMLAWALALQRASLLTAILSNMGPEVLRAMRRDFPWLAGFNQLTWSCELGMAKPDPAIYTFTCDRLGVRPDETLFLDDKIQNIHAAEQLGMHAIQFTNVENLRRDLATHHLLQNAPQPQT